MKKPTKATEWEAIEWLRGLACAGLASSRYAKEVLAYLDSIHEWPADLARERLEELAQVESPNECSNALRRLAAVAPKREKRKGDLWWHDAARVCIWAEQSEANRRSWIKSGWRKVGEAEIDA